MNVLLRLHATDTTLFCVCRVCQERARALSVAADNVRAALAATEETLREFDVPRALEARLGAPVGDDVDAYLADVDKLLDAAAFFDDRVATLRAAEPALRGAKELLARAMARCAEKLRSLLDAHARDDSAAAPPGAEPPAELPPAVAAEALPAAAKLVQHMASVGDDEYEAVFVSTRSAALETTLRRQGLDKLAAAEAPRLPPEALGERSLQWARLLRWAAALLAAEAPLATALLPAETAPDALAAVADASLNGVCGYGEAVAGAKRSADRLFAFVDVHTAAATALPQLRAALGGDDVECGAADRLEALRDVAGDAAAEAYTDLEASVGRDDRRPAGPDGTVHPLAASTMATLRRLFQAPQLFDMLTGVNDRPPTPPPQPPPQRRSKRDPPPPPPPPPQASEEALEEVGAAALRVIVALHSALDARGRGCKAPGLRELFLLNNVAYVTRAVRRTPLLLDALGESWAEAQDSLADAHAEALVAATWGAAEAELRDLRGLDARSLGVKDRERVKDKFRTFNDALDTAAAAMPHWSVTDEALREQLRHRLQAAVLQPYEALYDAFAERCEPRSSFLCSTC